MRLAGLALLLLFVQAAAAPARPQPAPHVRSSDQALKMLKASLGGSFALAQQALALSRTGDDPAAHAKLAGSRALLAKGLPAALWMDEPSVFRRFGATRSRFDGFAQGFRAVASLDDAALQSHGARLRATVVSASRKKQTLLAAVAHQLTHAACKEVVDRQGPVMVNGVPQGDPQLMVEFFCTKRIAKIYVAIPTGFFFSQLNVGPATEKLEGAGNLLEVDPDGDRLVGIIAETIPEPTRAVRLDALVEVAGAPAEYFPEVM